MEFNEAKIPSRLAQMRPLIHDGEKSSFPFEFEMLLHYREIEFIEFLLMLKNKNSFNVLKRKMVFLS